MRDRRSEGTRANLSALRQDELEAAVLDGL